MPDPTLTIHPLSAERLDRVRAFFRAIDSDAYLLDFAPHPFTDVEAQRVCGYAGRDLYVGVFARAGDGAMVGYGMLRGLDEGYEVPSLGLCVLAAQQGRGIGRMLLEHLLQACAERGAERAMLKVKRGNAVARALYESAGFRFEAHSRDFLVGYRALVGRAGT